MNAGFTKRALRLALAAAATAAIGFHAGGCDTLLPSAPESQDVLAEPLEDLTSPQLATHLAGDEEFARLFGPSDGLGPLFIAASCESCHIGDGKGHPVTTLTRFGRSEGATFDPMPAHGGPQLQHRAIAGYPPEVVPESATGVARFMPPAVTGLGFLEAVSDESILALADPNDADQDGISGVPNWVEAPDFVSPGTERIVQNDRYIGRFGKKAFTINLLHQTVVAYRDDMGITTDQQPVDNVNASEGELTGDEVPDPEVSSDVLKNVVFYIRTLKAPPRRDTNNPDVVAGEAIFVDVGCARCHVASMTTGPSDVAALSEKTFYPYTDLLLHDMGPELDDGYTEGSASTSEWRTAPLWGIGLAADSQGGATLLLHDGRASSIEEAVGYHGGEGSASRTAFEQLTAEEKSHLIAFLESL